MKESMNDWNPIIVFVISNFLSESLKLGTEEIETDFWTLWLSNPFETQEPLFD